MHRDLSVMLGLGLLRLVFQLGLGQPHAVEFHEWISFLHPLADGRMDGQHERVESRSDLDERVGVVISLALKLEFQGFCLREHGDGPHADRLLLRWTEGDRTIPGTAGGVRTDGSLG